MRLDTWQRWALAVLSGGMQVLCFPLAGPLHAWQSWLAFVAISPLLLAVLAPCRDGSRPGGRRAALLGYGCGIVFYAGNCYWIYQTMYLYGGMGRPLAFVILVLFSLYLGLYHAVFGWLLGLTARRGLPLALLASAFLWVAVELARARITCFPWDQLGMSQVDGELARIAPVAGVYGISFVLAVCAACCTALFLVERRAGSGLHWRRLAGVGLLVVVAAASVAPMPRAALPAGSRYAHAAVLLQPNYLEGDDRSWSGSGYERRLQQGVAQSTGPNVLEYVGHPADVVLWPESPAPLFEQDPRFQAAMAQMARQTGAPLLIGDVARDRTGYYNSANFFTPDGRPAGRYDKIHLVPFGEYIPFAEYLTFARALTAEAGNMEHGKERVMFRTGGHTLGVFICYESIFADEVRQLARNGADVLVNLSDDGWYGDTSAPWQHLNMARMRAIENHRWVLRDTNTGVTAAIDPDGHAWMQAPRHQTATLLAGFDYETDTTFYTRHGDWFAYTVTILAGAFLVVSQFAPGAKAHEVSRK